MYCLSEKQIDSLTELVLKTFDVPGIAVGVVKDGKLIHAKGYGIANLRTGTKVDANTLFGIACSRSSDKHAAFNNANHNWVYSFMALLFKVQDWSLLFNVGCSDFRFEVLVIGFQIYGLGVRVFDSSV